MNKYRTIVFISVLIAHAAVLASVIDLTHDSIQSVAQHQRIEVSLIEAPASPAPAVKAPQPVPQNRPQLQKAPANKPIDTIKTAVITPVVETPPQPEVMPAPVQEAPVIKEAPPLFDAAYLRNPIPAYPSISRRTGEEGKVFLRVLVDPQGSPIQIQLQKSSGFGRLDQAALETIHQWRFIPAKRGSQSIEGWVIVPITFRLES